MSRAKKLLFALLVGVGVLGMAGPAGAAIIHESVTIDTDQIAPGSVPPPSGGLVSLCVVIGSGNPATCIKV